MNIAKVTISKAQLASMPEAERIALILMGHAFNEINVLRKLLMVMGSHEQPPSQIVDRVQAGQVVIIMRILLGKCFEAWLMFTGRVQPLRAKYLPKLEAAVRAKVEEALNELYAYFNDGRMAAIRNQLAFHYRDDKNHVVAHWQRLSDDDPWDYYLHARNVNTFYYFSEMVITMILTQLALPEGARGKPGHRSEEKIGFTEAINLNNEISGKLMFVLDQFIAIIADENVPGLSGEEVNIGEPGKPTQLELPFFWDESDYDEFRK